MLFKWVIVASVALVVQSATITRREISTQEDIVKDAPVKGGKEPSIPVEVLYEEGKLEETPKPTTNPVKNLDEKIQLSPSDLSEALKHLPVQEEVQVESLVGVRSSIEDPSTFEKLGEIKSEVSLMSLVKRAENTVLDGIKNLREKLKDEEKQPSPEAWDNLERSLTQYFEEEKIRVTSLRQDSSQNQNFFQNIVSNFQNMTGGFVQNIQNLVQSGSAGNGTQSEEGQPQPGIGQNFITSFNNGVQNIQNGIQNIFNNGQNPTTSNTNLSDNPTTQSSNIFSNLVNNVQNFINPGQAAQKPVNGSQADETATTAAPAGPIQTIQNVGGQIGNAFNQFISGFQPNRPGSNGTSDEAGAQPTGPLQTIQQIGNNIGSSIQNIISGGNNKPPGTSGDEATSPGSPPTNFIQNVGQNLGQIWTNFVGGGSNGGSNPVVSGVQQVSNQISQVVTGNPISGVQNAIAGATGSKKPADAPTEEQPAKPADEPQKNESEPPKQDKEKKEEIMETAE